jgi:hypothetical protein
MIWTLDISRERKLYTVVLSFIYRIRISKSLGLCFRGILSGTTNEQWVGIKCFTFSYSLCRYISCYIFLFFPICIVSTFWICGNFVCMLPHYLTGSYWWIMYSFSKKKKVMVQQYSYMLLLRVNSIIRWCPTNINEVRLGIIVIVSTLHCLIGCSNPHSPQLVLIFYVSHTQVGPACKAALWLQVQKKKHIGFFAKNTMPHVAFWLRLYLFAPSVQVCVLQSSLYKLLYEFAPAWQVDVPRVLISLKIMISRQASALNEGN